MRYTYIVCYDICDPKRLRKVYKTMCDAGDHLQYSVFECQLTPADTIELQDKLVQIINGSVDQVLFIKLGKTESRGDREIKAIGKPYSPFDSSSVVV